MAPLLLSVPHLASLLFAATATAVAAAPGLVAAVDARALGAAALPLLLPALGLTAALAGEGWPARLRRVELSPAAPTPRPNRFRCGTLRVCDACRTSPVQAPQGRPPTPAAAEPVADVPELVTVEAEAPAFAEAPRFDPADRPASRPAGRGRRLRVRRQRAGVRYASSTRRGAPMSTTVTSPV